MREFNAWSFCRDVLSRGAVIERDATATGCGYEVFSAKMDAAARELADRLKPHLAAIPADDDVPADEAWWKSLGAHQLWADDPTLYVTKEVHYDCHEIGLGTPNYTGWVVVDTFGGKEQNAVSIGALSSRDGPATRGEVRGLLTALGIEVIA